MVFEQEKKSVLSKLDKSKKGSVDKPILNLINKINNHSDYYTTSSCSGRIVLLELGKGKHKSNWLYVSHVLAKEKDLALALKNLKEHKKPIWFKYEAVILHIVCKDIDSAQFLVNKARALGFKRTGIQSTRKKITVEMCSTELIDTIVADKGKLLVTDDYLKVLISQANIKLKQNELKIKKLEKVF